MDDAHRSKLTSILDHLETLSDDGEANALAGFHRYAEGFANVRRAEQEDRGANLQRVYDELQQLRRALAEDFFDQDVHRMLDITDQLLREADPEIGDKLGKASLALARWTGREDEDARETAREVIEELRAV